MDKKQKIEEIGKVMCEEFRSEHCGNDCECDNEYIAERLYNAGYRKIEDDCAVITKDELKEYKRQSVKEFAEKLKEYPLESKNLVWEYGEGWLDCYKTVKKAIDELLKEYE